MQDEAAEIKTQQAVAAAKAKAAGAKTEAAKESKQDRDDNIQGMTTG